MSDIAATRARLAQFVAGPTPYKAYRGAPPPGTPTLKADIALLLDPPEEPCRPCNGRGWVDDENWSPRYPDIPQDRVEGDGLIRCGRCLGSGTS